MAKDFNIRPANPKDVNFILATFSKSMKSDSALGRATSNRIFFAGFTQVIDHILGQANISIACELNDDNTILGYIIYELPDVIHFIYIKELFQGYGIAKELVKDVYPNAKTLRFSNCTNDAKKINKKYPELIYDPFILFKKGLING